MWEHYAERMGDLWLKFEKISMKANINFYKTLKTITVKILGNGSKNQRKFLRIFYEISEKFEVILARISILVKNWANFDKNLR